MARHAAGLALSSRPRGDREIVVARPYRRDQRGDGRRIVGAVAVHKDDNVGLAGGLRAGKARAAIAAAGGDHLGARAARHARRAVGAAAVGDDHAIDDIARQGTHDHADRFGFVEGGNDDGDAAHSWGHRQRLQRNPQLAHAAGGLSESSPLRKSR